jgi:hypothetical protein
MLNKLKHLMSTKNKLKTFLAKFTDESIENNLYFCFNVYICLIVNQFKIMCVNGQSLFANKLES